MRQMLLEGLEERQLLAVGPQLIGVQPNNSDLLLDGAVRQESPRELTFRFDDSQVIHPSTLDGIRITRSGGDGSFGLSTIASDFGTGGEVEILLTSVDPSVSPLVSVSSADLGANVPPALSVSGSSVNITLNSNFSTPTTARELVDAINGSTPLLTVLRASVTGGFDSAAVGSADTASYSPLRLQNSGDIVIEPGTVVVGDQPDENEVTVRFAETLPNDLYRVEIFGFDDQVQGIVGLRGTDASGNPGEFFMPSEAGARKDTIDFRLDLGPQVTSVVPQPVLRDAAGNLVQARDTVVVYFDGDKLLVENDASGVPTSQSAENPEFYQLIFTDNSVRNTDDVYFLPQTVDYNASANTATLRFAQDIDALPGVAAGARTFRLRIGTRETAPIAPVLSEAAATAISDFNTGGQATFRFTARELGEAGSGIQIVVVNSNDGDLPEITASGRTITVDLGSNNVTAGQLLLALQNASASSSLVSVQLEPGSNANTVLNAPLNYSPITVVGLGSSFDTATNLGVLGSVNTSQTSLILSSAIDAVPFDFDLLGGSDDPGHRELPDDFGGSFEQHINELFGADSVDGVTTVFYNFQTIYGVDGGGASLVNAITEKQIERAREVMQIWGDQVGVQFIETPDQGITIATGSFAALQGNSPEIVIENAISTGVRIDPEFESSLLVLDAGRQWGDNYGEDWFRAALTGVGMLLGLERAGDLPSGTLMRLSTGFINAGNSNSQPADEPVFPGVFDVQHGEHLFRDDSNDIDLYKFDVDFGSDDRVGLFVAETFAERLANSSPLDTLLHLYKQQQASAESNLSAGADLGVRFDAVAPGKLGNGLQVFVTKSERGFGAPVLINVFENLITIDLNSTVGSETTVQQMVDAINANPAAAALVKVSITSGAGSTKVGDREITYSPIVLQGGDVELISRNDDYFSEDSKIELALTSGVYYIGVSASGNDSYDPVIEDTGLGGTTQGEYDLRITFRAQVDTSDALRDMAGGFVGDQAVTLDGDNNGTPGGTYNFWFQTAPLNRTLSLNAGGSADIDGKIVTLTGANGVVRRFEFSQDTFVGIGNTPVVYSPTSTAGDLATALAAAINSRTDLGVSAIANGSRILLQGERAIQLAPGLNTIDVGGRTIFVDKSAGPNADGTLAKPFNNISGDGVPNAFSVAQPGDIVRIVGNGGGDGDIATIGDNFAYEIGFSLINGAALSDGTSMQVPQGVTTMVDAGAIFKLRRAYVGVGSNSLGVDRSGGALQVLGTPFLSDADGNVLTQSDGTSVPGSVYFTSWQDESIGQDTYAPQTSPVVGDWGGILYRNDVDSAAGRRNLEDEGIFLQYVNHADIRYGGGGNVVIDSVQQVVNPIQMMDVRPTVTFNTITNSSDAAMSAAPNSFQETTFHEPLFQLNGVFTSDYGRVGPEIHHNVLANNSINGLFVKVETPAGEAVRPLTVSARFDDIDIVHVVSENIIISGTPGGAILDTTRPLINLLALQPIAGGQLMPGTYSYKVSYVDPFGYETPASDASANVVLNPGETAVQLLGLPLTSGDYVARRLYRSDSTGGGQFTLVAELDATSSNYLDTGLRAGGVLVRARADMTSVTLAGTAGAGSLNGTFNYRLVMVDAAGGESIASDPTSDLTVTVDSSISLNNLPATQQGFASRNLYRSVAGGSYVLVASLTAGESAFVDTGLDLGASLSPTTLGNMRPRLDASLVVDPGAIIKLEGARIEIEQGANLIAEGTDGAPIIFTSKLDDRYGAGGTIDTNNDGAGTTPQPRDWGGIYASIGSTLSLDHATIAYAGGVTKIEGTFKAFSPVEIQQADARITNSTFEFNEDGIGGQGPLNRLGRLDNRSSTIFVRGAQPILVGNTFRSNAGSAINIDANSMNADLLVDFGRSTGNVERIGDFDNNRGPLVRENRMTDNELNGMEVRGDLLMVESVWDDTDIVHVLFNSITVTNVHHEGGLRLQSSPSESLVVKLLGYGSNHNTTLGTGFTATGFYTNAGDRVGGTIEIIGQPGFPVVLTSLHDDTVGAGLKPDGSPQTDTNNNGIATIPNPADWRSVLLDQFSNDRNVATVLELEDPNAIAPGFNSTTGTAQLLGDLAGDASSSDETLRLGFVVQGVLSEPTDVDVYSFTAEAGTEIWLDVDNTTQSLDLVVELLNANGQLLARSDNSADETLDPSLLVKTSAITPSLVNPLNQAEGDFRTNASGTFKDDGSINPRDAGLRVLLPGAPGSRTTFHFRIRSASTNPEDFNAGLTSGSYEVQLRTREAQEFPGSTVQYADIRYATNGVHLQGLPGHSPLLGEAQEDESSANGSFADNDVNSFLNAANGVFPTPGARDQYIGNILDSDRATISVGGELASSADLDFYRFDLDYVDTNRSGTTQGPSVVLDLDYADGLNRADTSLSVFRVTTGFGGTESYELVLYAEDSNIADDIRGPLSLTDIDDFSRGSVGAKDPFIGSVGLSEGTYSVAVSASGRIPNALSSAGVRREPITETLRESLGSIGTANGELVSSKFSLAGYSALDLPKVYFDGSVSSGSVTAFVRDAAGVETSVGVVSGASRQSVVSLAAFAGRSDLEMVFRYNGTVAAAGSINNLIIGFAERGERVFNAPADSTFAARTVPSNTIQTGEYQLEIRQAEDSVVDTNDRAADQITLIAPAGSELVDGDQFVLSDAGNQLTFEFSTDAAVVPGNVAVRFTATDTAAQVAISIRNAINDPGVQSRLAVKAAGADGTETGNATDARVNLFGRASGEFGKVGVIFHSGSSDQNTNRDQGQVLIQNNFIRHSRDYGVWTEPGERYTDSRDLITNIDFGMRNVMSDIPNLSGSAPGAVRNLREINDATLGGFNPGIIITNNVLESGGLGGVHVAGENPIWMITPAFIPPPRDTQPSGDHSTGTSTNPIDHFGTLLDDRDLFVLDAGRTRVQFEFEDIAGAGTGGPTFGSGVVQGNGWDDESVPIYYREDGGSQYLRLPNTSPGYSALEVVQSMRDSIFGSILVTNGTTQTVTATVAPSLLEPSFGAQPTSSAGYINYYNRPALYVEGVTNINYVNRNGGGNPFDIRRVDVADMPSAFARVVNNTIYGNDGRASFAADTTVSEPNDTIVNAVETWQGTAHNPQSFTMNAAIGDSAQFGADISQDVDLYQFKLDVGERVQVDIDTDPTLSNLDGVLQIFDASGVPQTFRDATGTLTTISNNVAAPGETLGLDPYIDFTATKPGVYYAAVSSSGNNSFDPLSLGGRVTTTTSGTYSIDLRVLHPQEFTITVEDPSQYPAGSTFTIFQVASFADGTNSRTFEFVAGGGAATGNNVAINIDYANFRAPDVARAIAAAITASDLNNIQNLDNGDFASANPLDQVTGRALGGIAGVEAGLTLFGRRNDGLLPTHSSLGIGHDRTASGSVSNTSPGDGTTERFVVVSNAAYIDGNGVILVDPDVTDNNNLDQLLPETGIFVSGGASPTLMNNVIVNVQTPIVREEAREFSNGLPAPFGTNIDVHPRKGDVIIGGSVYQFAEPAQASNRLGFGIEVGPTNLTNTGLDFNFTLATTEKAFVNAQASQFLPAAGSRIIDSSLDSLEEREAFRTVKQAMGISVSPVLAPARDATGQLRVDDPSVAPPNGQGANVFKDRGALDRADFVGPSAEAIRPLDNDSRGVDRDSSISVIQLTGGVYPEFRVQLVDGFEQSDPFPGIGIDDSTVVGPSSGLRQPGAAVTLFENGKLLVEGIDYSFSYNTTANELVFTPLAGVFKNDRVYEIAINNKNRFVVVAPAGDQVTDGDFFTVTDEDGGVVYFEFDSGFRLQVPQSLVLEIPLAGGAQGGIADGDRITFTINGQATTFEFDLNSNFLSGNRPIVFQQGASQQEMVNTIFTAIQSAGVAVTPMILDGGRIFLGAAAGTRVNTTFSTISQPATTLAMKIPDLGPRPGGITDGQTFTVSDGRRTVVFEYDSDGVVQAGNQAVDFSSALVAADLAVLTRDALNASPLNVSPTIVASELVHIGLSENGSFDVGTSLLTSLGVARTLSDGQVVTLNTAAGTVSFEFDLNGSVASGNVAVPVALSDTEDQIGQRLSDAIAGAGLGLQPRHVGGGNISVGGVVTDTIDVTQAPALGLFGQPGVQSGSTLQVFGPLLLNVPSRGAADITDNSTFSITNNGLTVVFEFDSNFSGPSQPGRVVIRYNGLSTQSEIALSVAQAINTSGLGIVATTPGNGRVNIGPLQSSQVSVGSSSLTTSRGVVSDGETFTISNGSTSVTFEFENVDVGNGFAAGNRPILFSSSSTADTVVASMKAVIEGAGLGLVPTSLPGGFLALNDTPKHVVDTLGAPALLLTGVPGGANAVSFVQDASFTSEDMKLAMIDAINLASDTNLIAKDRGSNTLFVENAAFISPEMDNYYLRGVADLAGNLLKPNRVNNETEFTILMPGVTLDYGDAPDPFTTTSGRYATDHVNDGARHVVGTTAILGSTIDAEINGQPTPGADGDTDDGVVFGANLVQAGVFNRNVFTSIDVTLSSAGYVDGWIDFNADGDWDDPGEQIFDSVRFTDQTLSQTFLVTVPSTAPIPLGPTTTFARFRSSSTGDLVPTGLAVDGEVEDYAVTIVPGTPPTAVNDSYALNEDSVLTTTDATGNSTPSFSIDDGFAANDVDPDGGTLRVEIVDPPAVGTLSMPATKDGTFTYTPPANFNGAVTFTYKVNDGTLNSNNVGTVTLTVREVNDTPIAVDDNIAVDEDQVLDLPQATLLANDSAGSDANENSQALNVTSVDSVSLRGGTVVLSAGRIIYTPPTNYSGPDEFSYTITDNGTTAGVAAPLSTTARVILTVADKNDPPLTSPDSLTTVEDTSASISTDALIGNDSPGPANESGQSLQFVRVLPQSTNGGTLVVSGGEVVYTPAANFVGTDTFFYEVEDNGESGGLSDPQISVGTVTVTVTGVNDAPSIDVPFGEVVMLEDASARIVNLSDVFFDPDVFTNSDVLTYEIVSNSNDTLVSPVLNGGQLELQLNADQNGSSLIVVRATDLDGESVTDTLTLTVTPVNDAPRLAAALPDVTVNEDATAPQLTLSPTYFFDPDVILNGDRLTFAVVSNSNPLLVTPVISSSTLTLNLSANQSGLAVITISATDSSGQTINDTFTLVVNPVNDAPVATADTYTVAQGQTLITTDPRGLVGGTNDDGVLANDFDPEGSAMSAVLVSGPQFASVFALNSNGTFTYGHNFANGRTQDTFTYRASDGTGQSVTTTVTIDIGAPPAPPHQNPVMNLDVNADGFVSPIDALLIVNFLNTSTGDGSVAGLPAPPPYRDVNGDNFVTPLDALLVINALNTSSNGGGGEGEFGLDEQLAGAFASVDVTSFNPDNVRVGVRVIEDDGYAVYGPVQSASASVFGEFGDQADSAAADTSWVTGSVDFDAEDESVDLALDSLLGEFGLNEDA